MSAPVSDSFAATASAPAAGSKRRASDAAASGGTSQTQPHSVSGISDDEATDAADVSASSLASAEAAASSPAADPAAVAARKKQRHESSAVVAPHADSASAAAPPASAVTDHWSGLYSDALHSILQFASLSDLSRVLAVSRGWSMAVTTMPPIHATSDMGGTFNEHRLEASRAIRPLQPTDFPALRSRLARHVSSFAFGWLASQDGLEAVAQYMPWMRALALELGAQPHRMAGPLGRFRSLTSLKVECGYCPRLNACEASVFNSIIAAIGGLPIVQSVTLSLPLPVLPQLSFAPLITLKSLHTLTVTFKSREEDDPPSCTESQIAEFRSMRSLTSLYVGSKRDEFLVRVLQPGHALQWTQLPPMTEVTEPLAPLLGSLPSLTALDVFMVCSDVSFLSQLPQLTDVHLSSPLDTVDPDALVCALSHCTHIRRLELHELQLNGDHLAKLLPCFPKLAHLSLMYFDAVSSLRCLDTPALAASLTHLSLEAMSECPPSELVHLLNLRSLDSLVISDLADSVSDELKAQFMVPSPRFPCLHATLGSVRIE